MGAQETRPSLLRRVRDQHDDAAWREFDARYRGLILRYCRRMGARPGDAEDVLQLVLMRLMKALPGFRYDASRGRFRTYLGQVVRSSLVDHLRRSSQQSMGAAPIDTERWRRIADDAAQAEAEAIWQQEWMGEHYRRALETVRQRHRPLTVDIFERVLAGEPVDHVAKRFGTTAAAVHKIKQRIRDQLSATIGEQIEVEDRPGA
ncbi:MAG: sigma-70 family RNA polymerase sigma factor [Planctomycetota bacterium]